MNALRVTHWPHPDMPTTLVLLESDMKLSPLEAVEDMLDARHGFFTYEVFEVDEDDIVAATMEAVQRAEGAYDDERNMAIAYLYYVQTIRILAENGLLAGTLPAPLSREQMAWVLRSLAKHENYKGQSVQVPLEDGTTIEMKEGEVLPA